MGVALLPNGKQQFIDGNGDPLAGGYVYFYVPNTSPPQFKDTWQDINQVTKNANPVLLDADGRAVIWGSGIYRQVLYDLNDALVWDQIVSVPEGSASVDTFYDFAVYMEGLPEDGELYPVFTIVRNISLPTDLTGSQFSIQSGSLPTSDIIITLQKNGVSIGTITVDNSGAFSVSFLADVFFSAGDQFSVLWPSPQDATAGDISLTFVFQLG
jgi:hypothetical protein